MTHFFKPAESELNSYQKTYVGMVEDNDLIGALEKNRESALNILHDLTPEKKNYRYASGKWSIPEIIVHILDTERIFNYRMLCFSRGEKNSLPGFEENEYALGSFASERTTGSIVEEYNAVRSATIALLKSFNEQQFLRKGKANNNETSVQILSYMLAGHERHHLNVIKEKYLN